MSIRLLHHARGVGARDVAMQPALGVRDHRHRIGGCADGKPFGRQLVDQRLNLRLGTQHEFDVAAGREAHVALGELVADVAELADGEHVHLALRAGAHRPHLVAALGDVMHHAHARVVVPGPRARSSSSRAGACRGTGRARPNSIGRRISVAAFIRGLSQSSSCPKGRRTLHPAAGSVSRIRGDSVGRAPCARSTSPPLR